MLALQFFYLGIYIHAPLIIFLLLLGINPLDMLDLLFPYPMHFIEFARECRVDPVVAEVAVEDDAPLLQRPADPGQNPDFQ